MKRIIIAAISGLLFFAAANAQTAQDQKRVNDTTPVVESQAAPMMFKDFEVDGVKLSDFAGKGKVLLVDFWASWCGPCKAEIPNIAAVYKKYHGKDFDVLSVAVSDKPENSIAAAKEHGVVWNQIINAQKIPAQVYGFKYIPYIILIGADGTILETNLRGEAIEKAVKKALGR